MKRGRNNQIQNQTRRSKRLRSKMLKNDKGIIDTTTFVSASKLRNYMLNDPVLDYFQLYGTEKLLNKFSVNQNTKSELSKQDNKVSSILEDVELAKVIELQPKVLKETVSKSDVVSSNVRSPNFLMKQGIEFENVVVSHIRERFSGPGEFIKVTNHYSECVQLEYYEKTKKLLEEAKVSVIYQGVVVDFKRETFGIPDLIVRNDCLEILMNADNIYSRNNKNIWDVFCDELSKDPNGYTIVDIKYASMNLLADLNGISNSGSSSAYKAQMHIYANALNSMLPSKRGKSYMAFLLGRSYSNIKNRVKIRIENCFGGLAGVSILDHDLCNKTSHALDWVKKLRMDGDVYHLQKRLPTELYPNMSNWYDNGYRTVKSVLADRLKDITLINNVGYNERRNAHLQGIYEYDHPNLTAEKLGIRGAYKRSVVNQILELMHSKQVIYPNKITTNVHDWKTCRVGEDFYVDYEVISNVFDDLTCIPHVSRSTERVFMIGVGFYDKLGKLHYRCFHADDLSQNSEISVFRRAFSFMYGIKRFYGRDDKCLRIYHWGAFEKTQTEKAIQRIPMIKDMICDAKFIDYLSDVMRKEPVLINGTLGNMGLKKVANALSQHGCIPSYWVDQNITSGLAAMEEAFNIYKSRMQMITIDDISEDREFQNIIQYNEDDVRSMADIIQYLRTNHV